MIAPSMPGGVFSVTSTLLTPVLGFSDEMVTLMSGLYFKQGTTNSAVNNTGDIAIGTMMSKKKGE
jgi:Na+/H+-dicarboxylate symporter